MTSTKQGKIVGTDAIALDDAALDQAAGGNETVYFKVVLTEGRITAGDGSVKPSGHTGGLIGIDYRP